LPPSISLIVDQAALHGVLAKARDTMPLISVNPVASNSQDELQAKSEGGAYACPEKSLS